jgi:hypothetical protein
MNVLLRCCKHSDKSQTIRSDPVQNRIIIIIILPKQQSSKKFFAMIEILNQFILPKFVNNTTSFKKIHSIIYSGALTIIRLNGSKEIDQTNNIKAKELPKWERRLNKRINNIRRDLGRITQYL